MISEIQPEFLLDGVDSIGTQGGTVGNDSFTIELDQDTVGEENNFGERGREAKRISLSDFLSTTPRDSVLIASHAETGSTKWYAIEGGWIQAAELSAAITAETLQLDVEGTDDRMHYATISYMDIAQVRSMPGANGTLLARVVGSANDLFQTVEVDFSNPDQPEGEADTTPVGSLAEGEADAEGEATATLATMMHEPITVQTDAATEGATEDLMLVSPEAPTTGSLFDSPAEGEAKTVAQSTASIDSVLVEIGFEEDSDTVERLIEGMQEDEDDFAAAADELFSDLAATDEPQ